MFVDFRERDDAAPTMATRLDDEMVAHPRTPGTLWDQIGWRQQCAANLAADIERGAYQRKGWFGSGNPDRAA
jgi:hypothetical protein